MDAVMRRAAAPRRAPVGAWPLIAGGAILAAVVSWWWWVTTDALTSLAGLVTEAGRLTGFGAGLAVIALVTLAARIGPLDRALGSERLYLWHGRLGRYAIGMIVAHAILITAGYALAMGDSVGSVILSFLADHDMRLAIVGTGLFLVVGVASMAAVRRAARYEVWHAIHLVTYAAILLGLFHQVTLGAQFADQRVASALWVAACVVPVIVLLINRLVRPLVRNARQRFTLVAVVPEAPGIFSLIIGGRDLERVPALAGQYLRVHANARGLRFASNPYSLSVAPGGSHWRITVGAVGEHSRRLVSLAPGTRLWLEGPLGGLALASGSSAPVLLIAGGTGVAPIRALAEAALLQRPWAPVVVWYRVHDPAEALFGAEWARLTAWARGRIAVHLRAGSRTLPGNQLDAAALRAVAPWIAHAEVLVCGGRGLVESARKAARQAGASNVRVESFGW